MKKRNLIICAARYVHENGGYLSRILSEIDKIYPYFNIYVFIPEGVASKKTFGNVEKVIKYPFIDKHDFFSYLKNVISSKKRFNQIIREIDNPIIYCEALVGSMWILKNAKQANLQIVFDCHGTEADEVIMYNHSFRRLVKSVVVRHFEKYAVNSSDLLVTVSDKQYEKWHIEKTHVKYPMVPSPQFFEMGNMRKEMREELCIPDDAVVFVYSGGTSIWQMCDETISLYKRLENIIPNAFLLVLTGNQETFKDLMDKYLVQKYCIFTVKYEDVPKYLDVADYGFCIRANHVVNNVASPTKILEYLVRNVKPVITDCIGDFSKELGDLELACVLNESLDNLNVINKQEYFDGTSYVKKAKEEYVTNYVNALKLL